MKKHNYSGNLLAAPYVNDKRMNQVDHRGSSINKFSFTESPKSEESFKFQYIFEVFFKAPL